MGALDKAILDKFLRRKYELTICVGIIFFAKMAFEVQPEMQTHIMKKNLDTKGKNTRLIKFLIIFLIVSNSL